MSTYKYKPTIQDSNLYLPENQGRYSTPVFIPGYANGGTNIADFLLLGVGCMVTQCSQDRIRTCIGGIVASCIPTLR